MCEDKDISLQSLIPYSLSLSLHFTVRLSESVACFANTLVECVMNLFLTFFKCCVNFEQVQCGMGNIVEATMIELCTSVKRRSLNRHQRKVVVSVFQRKQNDKKYMCMMERWMERVRD